jgi:hypothetical protein
LEKTHPKNKKERDQVYYKSSMCITNHSIFTPFERMETRPVIILLHNMATAKEVGTTNDSREWKSTKQKKEFKEM